MKFRSIHIAAAKKSKRPNIVENSILLPNTNDSILIRKISELEKEVKEQKEMILKLNLKINDLESLNAGYDVSILFYFFILFYFHNIKTAVPRYDN